MQQETEIFHEYEIKGLELSPRIYKIIGAAAALHLFAFIVFGQIDLIGTKACDSPYVGQVCRVLDAAYVGSVLLGTDTEFASRDYDKTEIDEADVTFIDVSEEFKYPEGYFAMSNPMPTDYGIDQYGNLTSPLPTDGSIPGIPNTFTSPSTLDPTAPAVLPTPNPNAVQGDLPNSPFSTGGNPTVNIPQPKIRKYPFPKSPRISNESPKVLPNLDAVNNPNGKKDKTPKVAKTPEKQTNSDTTATSDGENKLFNKRPLEDFGAKYGDAILKNDVNINAPFTVEVSTKLDENGKFVKPVMVTKPGSDEKMTEVAKEAIAAFGDSQLLKTLYDVGGRNIKITFSQNNDNLQAIILAETESDKRANTLLSLLNLVLKNVEFKEGSDEQVLVKKAQLSTEGKNFIINFLIPNDEKSAMIKKNLEKLQEKLKQQKQGVAEAVKKDASSAK